MNHASSKLIITDVSSLGPSSLPDPAARHPSFSWCRTLWTPSGIPTVNSSSRTWSRTSCVSPCLSGTNSPLTVSRPCQQYRTLAFIIALVFFTCSPPSAPLPPPLPRPPTDFLGRTEIRLAEIKKDQGSKGPITKRLLLHEVPTGEIVVRLDLQLFEEPWRRR